MFAGNPSILQIDNMVDGKINGTMNESLELVCSVNPVVVIYNISWYIYGSVIKTGKIRELPYPFVARREDHNKTFTCVVQVKDVDVPFEKAVTLDIKC